MYPERPHWSLLLSEADEKLTGSANSFAASQQQSTYSCGRLQTHISQQAELPLNHIDCSRFLNKVLGLGKAIPNFDCTQNLVKMSKLKLSVSVFSRCLDPSHFGSKSFIVKNWKKWVKVLWRLTSNTCGPQTRKQMRPNDKDAYAKQVMTCGIFLVHIMSLKYILVRLQRRVCQLSVCKYIN
jgi:hypothetical protein